MSIDVSFIALLLIFLIFFIQVARHLTKLFDSMAKLKFEKDSAGNEAKLASGMWSKDGEYVDMDSQCDLSGQVSFRFDCWLVH